MIFEGVYQLAVHVFERQETGMAAGIQGPNAGCTACHEHS